MKGPSLRTVLLTGLLLLQGAVMLGLAGIVFFRDRAEAHETFREQLRFRAKTLAGVLVIDSDGLEFEASPRLMPEYQSPGSGAYAAIYDSTGKSVRRSPSLGASPLPAEFPWVEGEFHHEETVHGPDGIPCGIVTHSFVLRVEDDHGDRGGWVPPPPEDLRYQIVLAADTRPRDAEIGRLAVFVTLLGAVGFAVTALGGLALARHVLRPLHRMTEEASKLTPGDPSRRLRPESVVRELGSLASTLNSALDRLASALERERRFVSDASHELRTPLAVLRGNVDVLRLRDRSPEEYRDGLDTQARVLERMSRITDDLLALARADDGRAEASTERVELPRVAREACGEFKTVAASRGVALACATNGPVSVLGDETFLGQLVQNLVSNALKFTPAGGAVRVAVHQEDGEAVLDVVDSGPGIPAEERTRVFDRFHRVRNGADPREGAGLGLAIVAWIVLVHRGRVEVDDAPGGGAAFRVRLPLAPE